MYKIDKNQPVCEIGWGLPRRKKRTSQWQHQEASMMAISAGEWI
jgi:hypothetical protein